MASAPLRPATPLMSLGSSRSGRTKATTELDRHFAQVLTLEGDRALSFYRKDLPAPKLTAVAEDRDRKAFPHKNLLSD